MSANEKNAEARIVYETVSRRLEALHRNLAAIRNREIERHVADAATLRASLVEKDETIARLKAQCETLENAFHQVASANLQRIPIVKQAYQHTLAANNALAALEMQSTEAQRTKDQS